MYTTLIFNHKIDAAHFVPNCDTKCENIHGHTWNIKIVLIGTTPENGMLVDFGELKEIVNVLDHGCNGKIFTPLKIKYEEHGFGWFVKNIMNDIVSVPTAENIAKYLYEIIVTKYDLKRCHVTVEESPGKCATYPAIIHD